MTIPGDNDWRLVLLSNNRGFWFKWIYLGPESYVFLHFEIEIPC